MNIKRAFLELRAFLDKLEKEIEPAPEVPDREAVESMVRAVHEYQLLHPRTEFPSSGALYNACNALYRSGVRMTASPMPDSPICGGDFRLGTACGKCSKCSKFDPAKGWKLRSWNSRNASGLSSYLFENSRDALTLGIDTFDEQDAWKLLRQYLATYGGEA